MLELELAQAREREFAARIQTIESRMEWDQISTIQRLERALQSAKRRLYAGGNSPAHA